MKRSTFLVSVGFILGILPLSAQNTNFGIGALSSITTGTNNSAFGAHSLRLTTTGSANTGIGYRALINNVNGGANAGIGISALENNINGTANTATGPYALYSNSSGNENSSYGIESMSSNTSGSGNTGIGSFALNGNTTGEYNACVGLSAGNMIQTGDRNSSLGLEAGPNAANLFNTTALGNNATTTADNQVRVGDAAVTSIGGFANWSNISDGRFKNNVTENVIGLDFIMKLRPVSYTLDVNKINTFLGVDQREHYLGPNNETYYQTGFIAQEVEAIAEEIGFTSFNGVDKPKNSSDHYGIRYAEFVVPLVKSVQELNQKQEELLGVIKAQQKQIDELMTNAGILKESSIIPLSKDVELYQNTPNPFSTVTEIKMNIPEEMTQAQIIIYNLEGKQLKSYPVQGTGNVSVTIEANELEAGMYIYTLISNNRVVATKQMILTK